MLDRFWMLPDGHLCNCSILWDLDIRRACGQYPRILSNFEELLGWGRRAVYGPIEGSDGI